MKVIIFMQTGIYAKALKELLSPSFQEVLISESLEDLARAINARATDQEVVVLLGAIPRQVGYIELLAFLRDVLHASRGRPVALMTSDTDPLHVSECLRMGIRGYIVSGEAEKNTLLHTLDLVSKGALVLGAGISRPELSLAYAAKPGVTHKPAALVKDLTHREQEVYHLIGRMKSNREIALQLGITLRTVQIHVERIAEKLGLRSRTEVAVRAALEIEPDAHGWSALSTIDGSEAARKPSRGASRRR